MEKLPSEVAQGSAKDKPVEATPSDDEDAAAALMAQPEAEGEPTVTIDAQDATETKPLLVSEQDPAPAPPVQGKGMLLVNFCSIDVTPKDVWRHSGDLHCLHGSSNRSHMEGP